MNNAKEQVKKIICDEHGYTLEQCIDSASLRTDLKLNEIKIMKLIFRIEKVMSIKSRPVTALGNIQTVKELVDYAERL
ncbi:acyl carrier protein [Pantoea endophytica]|uniref:Acyl carrier protein n=1 Tax=Pantoea sp. BJ2 TaxID=3141322 RepID=A0AAU7U3K8_9GAMM